MNVKSVWWSGYQTCALPNSTKKNFNVNCAFYFDPKQKLKKVLANIKKKKKKK